VYDGQSPDANPYADFDSSGNFTVRYLFGPGVVNGAVMSVILARTSSGGTTAWYLTDKLGSVRDIVSTTGTVLDHVVYDSFGNIVTETNAANGDRFKFAGMQYGPFLGSAFDHARYYNATVAQFASQDPLMYTSALYNLRCYVDNDVTNSTDPSGLLQVSPNNDPNQPVIDAFNELSKEMASMTQRMKQQMAAIKGVMDAGRLKILPEPTRSTVRGGIRVVIINEKLSHSRRAIQVRLMHEGSHVILNTDEKSVLEEMQAITDEMNAYDWMVERFGWRDQILDLGIGEMLYYPGDVIRRIKKAHPKWPFTNPKVGRPTEAPLPRLPDDVFYSFPRDPFTSLDSDLPQ
jgi:RHS repeat-associated protein